MNHFNGFAAKRNAKRQDHDERKSVDPENRSRFPGKFSQAGKDELFERIERGHHSPCPEGVVQ